MADLKYTNWNSSPRRGGHLRSVGIGLNEEETEPVMVVDDEPEEPVADPSKESPAE